MGWFTGRVDVKVTTATKLDEKYIFFLITVKQVLTLCEDAVLEK